MTRNNIFRGFNIKYSKEIYNNYLMKINFYFLMIWKLEYQSIKSIFIYIKLMRKNIWINHKNKKFFK